MSKKRGKLSLEEENYIMRNVHDMSVEEIAEKLNRTTAPVERYIRDRNLVTSDMDLETQEEMELRQKLKGRKYFKELKKQFDDEELEYFEYQWIEHMMQFNKQGVLHTEEMQIVNLITQYILLNRSLVECRKVQKYVSHLEDEIRDEKMVSLEMRDMQKLAQLEADLAGARSSLKAFTNERNALLEKADKINKELKANRADRIKTVEDSKTSFTGLIKMLEDEQFRLAEGRAIEKVRVAKDKIKKVYSEYHSYNDQRLDRPFLTPDTVREEK